MLKKILLTGLAALTLAGCTDKKTEEKNLLNDIIKCHDKVMTEDGAVMKNKMQLTGLAATNTVPGIKDSAAVYSKQLDNADDVMMNWMYKFNPDLTNTKKSHDEIMTYLNVQKVQIVKIDSQLVAAIAASDKFIAKNKTK